MRDKLLIIGAGGHGRVVADIAIKMNRWNNIAFLDDDETRKESMGIKVVGKTADVQKYIEDADIFIAIGENATRKRIQEQLELDGARIPILIHPSAVIGTDVEIGEGTVVIAGVVINCSVKVGKGCIINTGATLGHDSTVENYVHIASGANLAGAVTIKEGAWIGIGSTIINNIVISKNCVIGAGAAVIHDIPEDCTAVGNPAKIIKYHRK